MKPLLRTRLSIMMFLEFFIWGAWLPKIFGYLDSLHFAANEQVWILNAFAMASLTAMFFSTQFADRTFAAERFLAFSQLVGGLAMLGLFYVDDIASYCGISLFWAFFSLMLLHCLFYVPTISITNAIAFSNLQDAQKDFGPIRLWGTIGWIAASWPFVFLLVDWSRVPAFGSVPFSDWLGSMLKGESSLKGEALINGTRLIFLAAGGASLLLAAFSLVLPHTPPRKVAHGQDSLAWLEAIKLLRYPFILVLFIVTFLDATVHQCYFVLTEQFLQSVKIPPQWTMPVMSLGQIAEVSTMAILGLVLKKLGWKTTMIIGVLGHTVRFGVFALFPDPTPVILVNVLHGICYAFFFATVYIFVDEFFPKDARSSAQGLFNFLILGAGPFAGNYLSTQLKGRFEIGKVIDYRGLFLVLASIGLAGAIILLLFFWPPQRSTHEIPDPVPAEDEPANPYAPATVGGAQA